jgi:hypothetical protein
LLILYDCRLIQDLINNNVDINQFVVDLVIRYDFSGGDDKRVLLWNVEKVLSNVGKPDVFKGEHNSNIFCLAFDVGRKKIFSGGLYVQFIGVCITNLSAKQ